MFGHNSALVLEFYLTSTSKYGVNFQTRLSIGSQSNTCASCYSN